MKLYQECPRCRGMNDTDPCNLCGNTGFVKVAATSVPWCLPHNQAIRRINAYTGSIAHGGCNEYCQLENPPAHFKMEVTP